MDFVIFSTADWDNPFWTNKQHVAATLAQLGHRVLYIDSMGLRKPAVAKSDLSRIFRRFSRLLHGVRKVHPNVWVVSPFSIPLQSIPFIRRLNSRLLQWHLQRIIGSLGFRDPILWTYSPLSADVVRSLNSQLRIYHCVDEIKAQPGMPAELIEKEEKDLLAVVDHVFVTAKELLMSRSAFHSHVHYLPNVADFQHFNQAMTDKLPYPQDIKTLSKPIIGFIGAISGYKLDFSLIREMVALRPQYQFVFIGKIGEGDPWTDIQCLKNLPNLHFIGPKDYQEIPAYLQQFSACLLPCVINDYTRNMFPMKFFEYLAAGRPVVTTPLPSLNVYSALCYTAATAEEFVNCLDQAVFYPDEEKRQRGLAEASRNTYLSRMKTMLQIIGVDERLEESL